MSHKGKDICNELKAVRRKIAAENNIPLDIPECPHQGPCPGTCPQCEKEVRYLENALASRINMGKVATVAGMALALAAPATVQAQSEVESGKMKVETRRDKPQAKLLPVQGTIIDSKTKEPIPFCSVSFTPTGETAQLTVPKYAVTDFDGIYKLELPEGDYTMRVAFVGYKAMERAVKVAANNDTIDLSMEATAQTLGGSEVIMYGILDNPIIEYGPEMGTNTNIQGVPLRIQY